jgi:hypothetical protein
VLLSPGFLQCGASLLLSPAKRPGGEPCISRSAGNVDVARAQISS